MPPLEAYKRQLPYTYALGLYPAIQALELVPDQVSRVLVHHKLTGEGAQALYAACERLNIRTEQAERLLKRVSGKDNCYAAAVCRKEQHALDPSCNHLVLVNPMDAGNLGTILRSALGFSYLDIALITPCADSFEPSVIRASMGAVFSLRVKEFASFDAYEEQAGARAMHPFMLSDKALPLQEVVKQKQNPHSLIFGNEGSGLPASFIQVGQPVMIEQSRAVDSLNLAVSAALGMYSFLVR
ncbi:MAG: TrmH family RNA methyltransferase [Clostridiales bacterium]|nr:TrmH family RNA methyltransferase [Clostridiales bacterium]